MINSRVNEVKDVHDAVVLKDPDVADEESDLQNEEERILQRLLSDGVVLRRTCQLEGLGEDAEQKSPSDHHANKNKQTDIDEIKILKTED